MKTAAETYNVCTKSISASCNGRKDRVKGYRWQYYDEVNLLSVENYMGPGERLAMLAPTA